MNADRQSSGANGRSRTLLLLLILALFTVPMWSPLQAQTVTPSYSFSLATGGNNIPWNPNVSTTWQKYQGFYEANLFTGAYSGNITKVYWQRSSSTSGTTFTNLGIYLGQSSATTFATNQYFTPVSQAFYAASHTIPAGNAGEWFVIDLTTPFYYNPNQTLIVQICSDGVPAGTGFAVRDGASHTVPNVGRIYGGGNGCATTTPSGYSSSYRMNFGFDLNPALPDDAGIAELLSPVDFCAGTEDIKVKLYNYGTNTLNSVTINWTLNGVPQTPVNWTTPLPSISDATVTLGSQNFAAGVPVAITVWTSNPNNTNDSFPQNDTLSVTVQPALSGTFTIGGASPDFATFSDAVNELNTFGVCGPVVFNVRPGTYTERVQLQSISGTSATNTVTFQSETGIKTDVDLEYNATSYQEATISMGGANWVTFKDMTVTALSTSYGRAVYFGGSSTDCTFDNCELVSQDVNSTSTYMCVVYSDYGTLNHRTSFIDCGIREGGYGMYVYGGGSTSTEDDVLIQNCEFTGQYYRPVYCLYLGQIKFHDNMVYQEPNNVYAYRYPASFYYGYNSSIERNVFYSLGGSYAYGVYFYYENYYQSGNSRFVNNMISIINNGRAYYCVYAYRMQNTLFAHNSIYCNSTYSSSRLVYAPYANNSDVYNNIFYHAGGGQCWYEVGNGYINDSDYNLWYTTGNTLAYWAGNRANLGALQAYTGMDANSISKTVTFKDYYTGDLHLASPSDDDTDLFGTLLSQVTLDIDHEQRVNPYRGADEACYITPGSLNYSFVDGAGLPAAYAEAPGTIGVQYSVTFPDYASTVTFTVQFFDVISNTLAWQTTFTANKAFGVPLSGIEYITLPSSLQPGTYKIEVIFNTKNSCDVYRDYMPYPVALLVVGEGQTPCVVWPGDVNVDGIVTYVDRRDLNLYIFNANLRTSWLNGPARYQADAETNPFTYVEWKPQAAAPWATPEGCYMDTDGNGNVNNMDYIAMKLNWSQITPWYGGPPKADAPSASNFMMDQNYPNPFNPSTSIRYMVPEDSQVRLVITDALGRHVTELVNGRVDKGAHEAVFDASQLASGTYIATVHMTGLTSGMTFTKTIKMALSK